MNFDLKSILPVLVRYALGYLGVYLTTQGLDKAVWNGVQEWILAGVGIALTAGPVLWAAWKRPSSKALQVAQEVDKKVPAENKVVIETPHGVANIEVPGVPKK